MLSFSPQEQEILRAVFETLVPKVEDIKRHPQDFWERTGSEIVEPEDIAIGLAGLSPAVQQEFKQLLSLLDSWSLGLSWPGPWKPFLKLTPLQRQDLLNAWSSHRINLFRKGFSSLKKLSLFIYYTKTEKGKNPNWNAIGYPGTIDEATPPPRDRMSVLVPSQVPDSLTCEVLVIGSGAGGGVIAAELAAAGKDVLVVEKGPYFDRPDFNQLESEMISELYEAKGALSTDDGGVTVFAGSCLGGGTTVNWAGSFHTPEYILNEWADEHGNPALKGMEFQASLKSVAERIGVNTEYEYHNHQNQMLMAGSRARGHEPELIPRNERGLRKQDFRGIGFSCFGDRYGHKQGTVQTYLRDAVESGARILPQTMVNRVTQEGGYATGAEAIITDGETHRPVSIKAERVVVAAGAIHTPALLLRSGLRHKHLGKHLYFHPTVAVSGVYPAVSDPAWYGPMMSVVNNHFTRLEGNYGFKLETPPAHAGLSVLALPWHSGEAHKRSMLKLPRYSHFIVLTRDKFGGRVTVDKHGFPRMQYKIANYDLNHLLRGIQEGARIHAAAGAEEILFPHNTDKRILRSAGDEVLDNTLKNMPDWGWRANQFPLFSAHQMGTARMGGQDKEHPVKPNGETREVAGLYVADASLFPTASGVNPMLTIMGLAHFVAQGMK